jgi:N-acetylmuramoyl-L-alanine amidase
MSKPVVVLDPGHGGYDPGAVACGLKEKDLNLVLALKVAQRLEGVKVLLTRERDIYVSLADRVALSRRAEPDLFLSLHANAGGGRGFESFIYSGLGAKDPALQMQKALHGEVMGALNRWEIPDRGLKRAAFYVLRQNPNPAVLIESLFIDNAREAGIWREPPFVEALAGGVARGVQAALGLSGAGLSGRADAAVDQLYLVQAGAFSFIENARQRLAEVQQAGFNDAFITQKLPLN